jgi:hypothetical protein
MCKHMVSLFRILQNHQEVPNPGEICHKMCHLQLDPATRGPTVMLLDLKNSPKTKKVVLLVILRANQAFSHISQTIGQMHHPYFEKTS